MDAPRQPWDRLPDESPDAYTRFLIYRNLGPNRSLRKAYLNYLRSEDGFSGPATAKLHIPGHWHANSVTYQWVNRSAAWDVRNLMTYGAKVAVLHIQTLCIIAKKTARAARETELGGEGWLDVVAGVRLIGDYLTPEVVRGIHERQPAGQEPVPVTTRPRRDPDE